MLENIAEIFDETYVVFEKPKRKRYEARMAEFQEKHGHYVDEMLGCIREAEDKKATAAELAEGITQAVFEDKSTKGFFGKRSIKGEVQTKLNLFMIYYVFPAILLTEDENAGILCDALKESWGSSFKNSKIDYADYNTMCENFNDKLLGAF